MDPDLFLVIGTVISVLTVPPLLSAYVDRRTPRTGVVMALIAGTLIALALNNHPGGYKVREIPDAFYRIAARAMN